jgi:DNA-binding ferritin-like protein
MKKFVALLVGGVFAVSATTVFAVESCVKCHKTMDKVAEAIKKSGAKSADELVDFLRNKSAKKALHKSVKDEDIKKAFAEAGKK